MDNATIDLQHAFYDMLMQSQYWSPERMRDYQRSQLTQLLRHAKRNVPFYENRLDAVMLPNGDIDWNRWSEIPIVKRIDLIQHREAMQARELPPGHGVVSTIRTSGSSGLHVSLSVNSLVGVSGNAFRWRVHRWQELDWSQMLCSRMGHSDNSARPDSEPGGMWGPYFDSNARQGRVWHIGRSAPSEDVFKLMQAHDCLYLNAGPNMAHINALDALRVGVEMHIDAILVQGNVVRDADREICQRVFGARMIEHYSAKEGGQIAHPCPDGSLHVNSEGVLVEIVDDNGEACAPGQTGRVIVTPLYLTAQPLVRYDQGDFARVGGPCRCGRPGQTIAAVLGRSIPIFHHPDGRAAASLMPEQTTALLKCSYWQLAQTGPLTFEMRYVPLPDSVADESAIVGLFRRTYFPDATLKFARVSGIRAAQSGKLAEYVNEWTSTALS